MTSLIRVAVMTAVALTLGALVFLGTRILFPAQMEDESHLDHKRRYLSELPRAIDSEAERPNLVVILFDDLGWGDLSSYGSRAIRTPNLDRLAATGLRFTQAYSVSPYCSASRAGLLTGRHPTRMGFDHVLQPAGTWKDLLLRIGARNRQLPADEILLPEVLAAAGYTNKMIGKWHLGDQSPSLPNDRGFQSFFGLLYSNDQGKPVLWRDQTIIENHPIDQGTLTQRYTQEAVAFLEQQSAEQPFFLYLAHTFPHVPLHASEQFAGSSDAGLYGDVVEELDASVGVVLTALERLQLARRTLVFITSDNGPWFQGNPGLTRGRKMDVFEGGMRVPLVIHWPGRTGENLTIDALVSGLDLFPTMLDLAGVPPPRDRRLDGVSLAELIRTGEGNPREHILYTQIRQFHAWRKGRYKYHARRAIPYGNPMSWRWGYFIPRGPWLFDLVDDPTESYDLSASRPEVAQRLATELSAYVQEWRQNPRSWMP